MLERTTKLEQTDGAFRKKQQTSDSVGNFHNPVSFNSSKGELLQRKADCSCGGGCPKCQMKGANLPISQPNDASEIEADRIADKVMRTPISAADSMSAEKSVQTNLSRKENSNDGQIPSEASRFFKSSGQVLDTESRNFFEPRFGFDFSRVKIHHDSHSNEFAENIGAKAFTVGQNIGFAKGEYEPNSAAGRKLLAHELTHIIQQNRAGTNSVGQIARQPKTPKETPPDKKAGECETFPGGATHCELTADEMDLTGKPTTSIDETNPCTKPCVIEHEDVHREHHKIYCPKQKACEKEADQGKRPKSECYEWMNQMKEWECKAYKVSYACMEKRLKNAKSCKSEKNKEYGTRKLASEKCFHDINCGSAGGSKEKKKTPEKKSGSGKK